jgi:hypothetical protein
LTVPVIYRTSLATRRSRRCSRGEKFFATGKICFTVGSVHSHCKQKTRFDARSASLRARRRAAPTASAARRRRTDA